MSSLVYRPATLLTTLTAILFIAGFSGCKEPSYQGIGLKRWEKQLDAEDPVMRADAAKAIGAIGKPAIAAIGPLHAVASNDVIPAVRLAAIDALKALGAPTSEFDAYVKEVTAPLVPSDDSDNGESLGSNDDQSQNGGSTSSEDDLQYLKTLEEGPDSLGPDSSVMPGNEEAQQAWAQGRRKEAVSSLLQEIQNPSVLAEMINTGDATQKRFAARLLQNQDGGQNADVFDALNRAKADSDSVLKSIAIEALKKWSNP